MKLKSRLDKEGIALRVAKEFQDGWYVNLGAGIPTLASNFIPQGRTVIFQAENGVLGYGHLAKDGEELPDLVNAGGQLITLNPGACFFHSADSFAMIRGGHIDCTVLGGLQVSEKGDLANWLVPEKKMGSIGGAMDLVTGAKMVIVAMEHTTKKGEPKILKKCTYPLTGKECVNLIITDVAVIKVTKEGLMLQEVAPGFTVEEVQATTEPRLIVSPDLKEMEL